MKKSIGQIAYVFLILALIGLLLWLLSLISYTILYVLLAILILLLMVTIHEFGHYIAGKALKFKINEFAIGFGPKLFSIKRKNGEIFSIRIFPLGGFCAFEGEGEIAEEEKKADEAEPFAEYTKDDAELIKKDITPKNIQNQDNTEVNGGVISTNLKNFNEQHPAKRIIVLLAGGVFNLLSAVIFSFIFIWVVGYEQPKIEAVYAEPNNPAAYYSTLQKDDVVIAIDGKEIGIMDTYSELLSAIKLGDEVIFTVERGGKIVEELVKKQEITIINDEGKEETYEGFGFTRSINFKKAGLGYALKNSVPFTGRLAWSILGAFGGLFTGRVAITDLTGPVGTVGTMAEVSQANWRNIFLLLPLIAANLGLFNLFPIPALDGSKVIFAVIEWIRKKPLNRNVEAYIHLIGMVALLLFVVVIDLLSFIL